VATIVITFLRIK